MVLTTKNTKKHEDEFLFLLLLVLRELRALCGYACLT